MIIDQQTGLYGPYDFVYTPWWHKPQYFIPILFVVLILLIILGYFFYCIITRIIDYYTPVITKAKKKLKKLEKLENIDSVDVAQELQHILKEYITEIYSITIVSFTPHECSLFLQNKIRNQSEKKVIQDFFATIESLLFIKTKQSIPKKELIVIAFSVLDLLDHECKKTNS